MQDCWGIRMLSKASVMMRANVGACRQADQAYNEVEGDRHYLQKQNVSHSSAAPELEAAQEHIRSLQRALQLLERKCAGAHQTPFITSSEIAGS